jgi:ADP-heptose:LPS heptosyltransferase
MAVQSKNILVLRFSAMGDVALLAPVLRSFLHTYPGFQITLATRPKFQDFFYGQKRLEVFPADVDSTYAGLAGIFRLFFDLRKSKPQTVLDLHDNLRSRLLCFLFRITGSRIVRFNKGRKEKRALTRKQGKVRSVLPHTVERYHDAFAKAGFKFSLLQPPYLMTSGEADASVTDWLPPKNFDKKEKWIGLAPFAAHKSKIWPRENYFGLIREIRGKVSAKFFLFGGGREEINFFDDLQNQFPGECIKVAGQLKLMEEIVLMKKLDKMICVDSSNMHLAALMGVPLVSIWGGTHSDAGFGPFGTTRDSTVQVATDELPCRPCSVYGKETCYRGDFACQARIRVADVVAALELPNK